MQRFTMCMVDLMTVLLLVVLALISDSSESEPTGDMESGFVSVRIAAMGKPGAFSQCDYMIEGVKASRLSLANLAGSPVPQYIQSSPDDGAFSAISFQASADEAVLQLRGAVTSRFDQPIMFQCTVQCNLATICVLDVVSSSGIDRPPPIDLSVGRNSVLVTARRRGNALVIAQTVNGVRQ